MYKSPSSNSFDLQPLTHQPSHILGHQHNISSGDRHEEDLQSIRVLSDSAYSHMIGQLDEGNDIISQIDP